MDYLPLMETLVGGLDGQQPMTERWACEVAGLGHTTHRRWMEKGRAGDPRYAEYAERMTAVVVKFKRQLLADITKDKDWKAKAWLLERMDPENFSAKPVLEVHHRAAVPVGVDVIDVEYELENRDD